MRKKDKILGIGWYVGGWLGRKQAIAMASWSPGDKYVNWVEGNGKLISASDRFRLAEAGGFDLLNLMSKSYRKVELDDFPRIVVAMNAPLGFPERFVEFVRDPRPLEGLPARDFENPLAFRFTDRWIEREFRDHNRRPLSPSFQSLTSNVTVALSAISLMRQRHGFKVLPQDADAPADRSIIEVFPALVKKSGNEAEVIEFLAEYIPYSVTHPWEPYDAAICAVHAIIFGSAGQFRDFPTLVSPPEGHPETRTEGWIYHLPRDFIDAKKAEEEL